jgi:hypothetical protein
VREARRLGFTRIEVWGPIEPLADLEAGAADKLAGLTRIRAPRLPGSEAGLAAAQARLGERLPACPIELYEPGDTRPAAPMYQSAGPRAVWASCQRAP